MSASSSRQPRGTLLARRHVAGALRALRRGGGAIRDENSHLRRSAGALARLLPASAMLTRAGPRRAVVTFDLASSPVTYGDYLYVLLIARLFQALGAETDMVVIDDHRREDMHGDMHEVAEARLAQYEELAETIGIAGRQRYHRLDFAEFQELRGRGARAACYPPRRGQDRRQPAYPAAYKDLELALRVMPAGVVGRTLLGRGDFPAWSAALPAEPYVVVAVRAASPYRAGADLGVDEYRRQISAIRARLPEVLIYVASDAAGTQAVRAWGAVDERIRYAQDFGSSFASNLALAVGASAFVQMRGGGLFIGPLFGSAPMFLCQLPDKEFPVGRVSTSPWRPPWGHELTRWCWPPEQHWSVLDDFLDGLAQALAGGRA